MLIFLSDFVALAMFVFIVGLIRYIYKSYNEQDNNPRLKRNIIGKDIDLHGKSLH